MTNFYLCDQWNHVIRKANSSGIITTIAGMGVAGYSGDGGSIDVNNVGYLDGGSVAKIINLWYVQKTVFYKYLKIIHNIR